MHKYDVRQQGTSLPKATDALVLLHGRGATAENILSLADYFAGKSWFVAAPQAMNHQWYPKSFLVPVDENEPWLSSAIDYVKQVIDDITDHVPLSRLYLMGFSQGACLAAEVTARFADRYGGIALFTGGLIGEHPGYEKYNGDFSGTRIYITNSDNDPHIPLSRSEETFEQLKKMGADVSLDLFPGRDHTILEQEIEKAGTFLLG